MIEPTDEMRMVAYRDAREWAAAHGHQQPDDRMIDDVLAVVLDLVERDRDALAHSLDAIHFTMATDSRDWSLDRRDARLYALLVGWECEEQHQHDEDCNGALDELAARFGWDPERIRELRRPIRKASTP